MLLSRDVLRLKTMVQVGGQIRTPFLGLILMGSSPNVINIASVCDLMSSPLPAGGEIAISEKQLSYLEKTIKQNVDQKQKHWTRIQSGTKNPISIPSCYSEEYTCLDPSLIRKKTVGTVET